MRKTVGLCTILLLFALLPLRVYAVSARSALVMDGTTQQVLFAQNADERLPMASTTKIMTAIVAMETDDLDRVYTVRKAYTQVEGSSMYLREGERITLRETLYGLLLMSGNDAATAIAEECGGTEHFVGMMNATAARLGLRSTHFDNPSGLDGDTHYTTARELARLAAYAMQNADFRAIVAEKSHHSEARTMKNHNRLLSLYADAVGVKTGFTKKSGRCLVSAAERGGRRLIAVTLNAPDDWNDHTAMLETAFAQYTPCLLHRAGAVLRTQPIEGGAAGQVTLAADGTRTVWLTAAERAAVRQVFYGSRFTYAPVAAGEPWGSVRYQIGDAVLAEDRVYFLQGAALLPEEKSVPARLLGRLQQIVPWGK